MKKVSLYVIIILFLTSVLYPADSFFDTWFDSDQLDLTTYAIHIGPLLVQPPPVKVLGPSNFPTIVFIIKNQSDVPVTPNYKLLLPTGWGRISYYAPEKISPKAQGYVRSTIIIPSNTLADKVYQVKLMVTNGAVSDTAKALLKIEPKPDIQFKFTPAEKQLYASAQDSISIVLRNSGNLSDIVLITPQLTSTWDIISAPDHVYIKPHEEKIVKVVVKAPDNARAGDRANLKINAKSLAAEKLWQPLSINAHVTLKIISKPKKVQVRSLNPVFPVNIGLTVNRINRDKYPLAAIYLQTGEVDLGLATATFEITQRSYQADFEETPKQETDRIRLELVRTGGQLVVGDAYVIPDPLMSFRSITQQSDFHEYGELSRGIQLLYNVKGVTVDFFRGRQLFSEDRYTYASTRIPLFNLVNIIPSYMERDSSNVYSLSTKLWLGKGSDLTLIGGTSELQNGPGLQGRAGQIRFRFQLQRLDMMLNTHWAEKTFAGIDAGKFGSMMTTRLNLGQSVYFWSHLHLYRDLLPENTNIPSTSFRVQARSVVNKRGWPFFNIGMLLRNDDHDKKIRAFNNNYDFQMHFPGLFIQPLIKYKYIETNTLFRPLTYQNIATIGWLAMLERFRIKFEESNVRINDNPSGWVTDVYVRTGWRHFNFGIYLSTGYIYRKNSGDLIEREQINDYGVRTNFMFHPFGKDYNVQLEVGKQTDYINDFKSDWSVLLSLTAGTVPRFHLPVPFVQSKARIYGQFFIDKNKNGIREADEPGVSQVLLFLDDQDVVSDANGEFFFDPIEAGEYPFHIDMSTIPASLSFRNKIPGSLTLWRGGQIYLQIPLYSLCSIDGYVYMDGNRNQKMDTGETGLEQVKITVTSDDKRQWEVYTNAHGFYNLPDLIPGVYTIQVDPEWLPRNSQLLNTKSVTILTETGPHSRIDFNVGKRQMEIRKTFSNKPQ